MQCDTCEQWFHVTSVCVSVGDKVNWVQCDTCEQWFHVTSVCVCVCLLVTRSTGCSVTRVSSGSM